MSERKDKVFHNVFLWGDEQNELKAVQSKFLKYFAPKSKVLDLGSGRGIFLDLLLEHGFRARGVEMDKAMYEFSKQKGHDVTLNNALDYLSNTTETYDGIFASHIIEHMPIEEGVKFVELIKTHLSPGGVAITITPRPGSLWATENFWLDTTHVRPYPYELMKELFAPLKEIAGGIEPDSYALKNVGRRQKLLAAIRKKIIGPELFDFAYGGGVWFIAVKKDG